MTVFMREDDVSENKRLIDQVGNKNGPNHFAFVEELLVSMRERERQWEEKGKYKGEKERDKERWSWREERGRKKEKEIKIKG